MGKTELIALLNLSSWCLMMVERLFLAVPRGCLQFVIVVFPDHTHLLFLQWVQKVVLSEMLHEAAADTMLKELTWNTDEGHWPIIGWVCLGSFLVDKVHIGMFPYVWGDCWCREVWKGRVKTGASSEDSSLSSLGIMPSGQAALEILRACRSFRMTFSVTWISDILWFGKWFLLTVPRQFFFCGSFMFFLYCVCYAFVRVCCLVVTYWERADLLAFVCGVLLWVCHFPIGIIGQVSYLVVSIPDLCNLAYFVKYLQRTDSFMGICWEKTV